MYTWIKACPSAGEAEQLETVGMLVDWRQWSNLGEACLYVKLLGHLFGVEQVIKGEAV